MVRQNVTVTVQVPNSIDLVFHDVEVEITEGVVRISRRGQLVMNMTLEFVRV